LYHKIYRKVRRKLGDLREKYYTSTLDYQIIVAHYEENLEWIKNRSGQYYDKVCVYHKGNSQWKNPGFSHWIPLKNVGREAHTYLTHIINNYDRLAEITIFLQGHIHDHTQGYNIFDLLYRTHKRGLFAPIVTEYSNWGYITHVDPWLSDLLSERMKGADFTFGEFYAQVFEKNPPVQIKNCWAGLFGVHRDRILRYPKAFYEKLIKYLDNHSNPENGHYFERLWYHLFQ
jgi:hypothetical protein